MEKALRRVPYVYGDLTGVYGDLSGVYGDVDRCSLTPEDREKCVYIFDLIVDN